MASSMRSIIRVAPGSASGPLLAFLLATVAGAPVRAQPAELPAETGGGGAIDAGAPAVVDGSGADVSPDAGDGAATPTSAGATADEGSASATPEEGSASARASTAPGAVASAPATCIGAVFARARPGIVRVESGLAVGAGFVVIDASHVVTSLSLVADGHGVRVLDVDGNARSARVIATAGDDDLALLELGSPLSVEPLELAEWEGLEVGREVVVASFAMGRAGRGRSGHGEYELGLTSGAVNALGERAVQVDAHPAVVGSPMLDCDGRVVGVAARRMMFAEDPFTFGAGSGAVADLVSRVGHPEPHGGRVRLFLGLGLSLAWEDLPPDAEPDLLAGGYLQVGITALDNFVLGMRGHFVTGSTEPSGSDVLRRDARRFRVDAYAGWRQLVSFGGGIGFHFELALGASASLLRDQSRRITLDPIAGLRLVDAMTERWRVRPLAMISIEIGWFVVAYQLELELEDRGSLGSGGGHAYHLFTIGFQS